MTAHTVGARPARGQAAASGFAACPLGPDPESLRAARSFTRSTLQSWGMHALVDSVVMAVSEMVTNALRYGLRDAQRHHRDRFASRGASRRVRNAREPRPGPSRLSAQPILLSLVRQADAFLCAVFDPGTEAPVITRADQFAESGRGLYVVESLSDAWGWTAPDHSGKAVWAMFSTASGAPAPRTPNAHGDAHGNARGRAHDISSPGSLTLDHRGAEWGPLARLLMLMEVLCDPPWLRDAGAVVDPGPAC